MSLPGVQTVIRDKFISYGKNYKGPPSRAMEENHPPPIKTKMNFIEVSFTLDTKTGEVIQATPSNLPSNANKPKDEIEMYDELCW